MEVVSDDSVERDWRDQYFEYEAAGVDEYWLVDPQYQPIAPYDLQPELLSATLAT